MKREEGDLTDIEKEEILLLVLLRPHPYYTLNNVHHHYDAHYTFIFFFFQSGEYKRSHIFSKRFSYYTQQTVDFSNIGAGYFNWLGVFHISPNWHSLNSVDLCVAHRLGLLSTHSRDVGLSIKQRITRGKSDMDGSSFPIVPHTTSTQRGINQTFFRLISIIIFYFYF